MATDTDALWRTLGLQALTEGQRQTNARIDKLYLAAFGLGGGIIAGLLAVVITIIVQAD